MNTMTNNKWVWRAKPLLSTQFRLICIAHAGGTATVFKDWHAYLPDWIDVVAVALPGRQQRRCENMPTRMGMLVRELATGIKSELDLPYALVGSCTGSLIAFELAHYLKKENLRKPDHLFVVSCRAPHLPDRDDPIHKFDDNRLREEMARLGGTPPHVLAHPEIMSILGPILRRDFELAETYTYRPVPPLECSISAFGGTNDEFVTTEDREAWKEHTQTSFEHYTIEGGHYLVEEAVGEICKVIGSTCNALVR